MLHQFIRPNECMGVLPPRDPAARVIARLLRQLLILNQRMDNHQDHIPVAFGGMAIDNTYAKVTAAFRAQNAETVAMAVGAAVLSGFSKVQQAV